MYILNKAITVGKSGMPSTFIHLIFRICPVLTPTIPISVILHRYDSFLYNFRFLFGIRRSLTFQIGSETPTIFVAHIGNYLLEQRPSIRFTRLFFIQNETLQMRRRWTWLFPNAFYINIVYNLYWSILSSQLYSFPLKI